MLNQPWEDAFQELWNHAAHHRGLREARGDLHGHLPPDALHQWPRTCGADVIAIASIVDAVLHTAPRASGGYGIERAWRHCTRELESAALGQLGHEYRHNRTFWSALAQAIAYLASVDVEVPDAMWQALPVIPRWMVITLYWLLGCLTILLICGVGLLYLMLRIRGGV